MIIITAKSRRLDRILDTIKNWNKAEKIKDGLAADKQPAEFDPMSLLRGMLIELEHTKDWETALEIAMDHLAELDDYYDPKIGLPAWEGFMERMQARDRKNQVAKDQKRMLEKTRKDGDGD